jgi:Na+-transporting methylmalonyl-CoA/oxaloacetate decarboxylase gamma subunit
MSDESDDIHTAATAQNSEWEKFRDEEFDKYYSHRDSTCKAEDEAEKNFDTTLITLATLAIGSTFTVLKDITKGSGAVFIFLSWLALGMCLFSALVDRLLSYTTHKEWREIFDREFGIWKPGAWERAVAAHKTIRFVNWLPHLKWVGFWCLLGGVVFLMIGIMVDWRATDSSPQQSPVIVNVYAASTQPTVRP